MLVVPRRHAPGFADLTNDEASDIGITVADLSRRLQVIGAERVHVATIGHNVDHLHVHLLPRWPGKPVDVAWHAVEEWAGARGVDAAGIATLCGTQGMTALSVAALARGVAARRVERPDRTLDHGRTGGRTSADGPSAVSLGIALRDTLTCVRMAHS